MSEPVTVFIADDHPLFRKGVADLVRADASMRLVGEANDGEQALALIRSAAPRVALLDIDMPKRSGLEIARTLSSEGSSVAVVLLTMHSGSDLLQEALGHGVRGFISKESAADDVIACVNLVATGRTYISASLQPKAVSTTHRMPAPGLAELTRAERNVLRLIGQNKTTREIAEELEVSPKTVENHRSKICQKLSVTGNNALVRFALEHLAELQRL